MSLDRCVAVMNGKGGVGKTSIVANVGALAAAAGYRVLLVDLDPHRQRSQRHDALDLRQHVAAATQAEHAHGDKTHGGDHARRHQNSSLVPSEGMIGNPVTGRRPEKS